MLNHPYLSGDLGDLLNCDVSKNFTYGAGKA